MSKLLPKLLLCLGLLVPLAAFAGEQETMGKVKLTITIVAPPELAAEGEELFASHVAWMKETHHREGPAALLYYDVSKMAELSDPGNLDSPTTGNTVFVLSETYETVEGVKDHYAQTANWQDWPRFRDWMGKCKTVRAPTTTIFNSLTWARD